jgi:uncharacterized protein
MRPLRDTAAFALGGVGEGGHSVVWPGEIDMGAARLLEMALELNGRPDAVEFIRWRSKHGLSLREAAEALGLSQRQVAYYASGGHEVPRDGALIVEDLRKDYGERRFQALGLIGDRLHDGFTPRANKAHVISLRKANKREVKRYEAQA